MACRIDTMSECPKLEKRKKRQDISRRSVRMECRHNCLSLSLPHSVPRATSGSLSASGVAGVRQWFVFFAWLTAAAESSVVASASRRSSRIKDCRRRSCETVGVADQRGEVFSVNAPVPGENGIAFCKRKTADVEIGQKVYARQQRVPAIRADHLLFSP